MVGTFTRVWEVAENRLAEWIHAFLYIFVLAADSTIGSRGFKSRTTKPYNSLRVIPDILLIIASDSSAGGSAAGTVGRHACLELGRTHFGQKRLPQSGQRCLNPGFPPPHAKPLHLALLVFFMDESTGALAKTRMLEPDLRKRKAKQGRAWFENEEGREG